MSTELVTPTVDRLVDIDLALIDIEEHVKALKDERAGLESTLLEDWAQRGMQRQTIKGRTVYVRHDFFCNKRPDTTLAEVLAAIRQAQLENLIAENYSAAALKSRVRDWINEDESGNTVPGPLRDVIKWDTVPRLISMKAN